MYQYYIIEIQKDANEEYSHLVHWAYDEDPIRAKLKAESQYHTILAAAAISELPQHSATLIASDGRELMHQCYRHIIEETNSEEGSITD